MDGWIDGWMDGWKEVCMYVCMYGCTYALMYVLFLLGEVFVVNPTLSAVGAPRELKHASLKHLKGLPMAERLVSSREIRIQLMESRCLLRGMI